MGYKTFSKLEVIEKMRAHAKSDLHIQASEAALLAKREETIVHQLQNIGSQEGEKNRAAIKSLIRCTHFLTRQHIPHSTNFDKFIDLVVSCHAQDLKVFLEKAARNAVYTSRIAVTEFIEALGIWRRVSSNDFKEQVNTV